MKLPIWLLAIFCKHDYVVIEDLDTPTQLKTLSIMDYYTKVSKCSKCLKEKEHN